MAATALPLDLHPAHTLDVLLLTGGDPAALLAALASRALDAAVVDARLVASLACVASAATRALLAAERAAAAAAAVAAAAAAAEATSAAPAAAPPPPLHAALVVALHGGRNAGEALRALGPRARADGAPLDLLFAVLDAGGAGAPAADRAAALERLAAAAGGARGDARVFFADRGARDDAAIAALYRVGAAEAALGLEEAVLARIAAGDA
jgi:hypothetical protein